MKQRRDDQSRLKSTESVKGAAGVAQPKASQENGQSKRCEIISQNKQMLGHGKADK